MEHWNIKIKEYTNKRLTFLGLEIEKFKDELFIRQSSLIRKVLSKFNMDNCKMSDIPVQPGIQGVLNNVSETSGEKLPYKELIGCLMYIMSGSRPDLSFSISYFSQFQNNFSDVHFTYLKNVLRYLKSTEVHYGLKFTKSTDSGIGLVSYVDADFAGDPIDRKSVTGFLIKLNNNIVCWKTKKQSVVRGGFTNVPPIG